MSEDSDWLALSSGDICAKIDPMGAQLSVLRDATGRDLLWDGNAAFWNGRAPLLFPIVGTLAGGHYRFGGKSYALSRHGFARGKPFEVLGTSRTAALLRLKADEQTLSLYPFHFELQVRYEVIGTTLSIVALVRNNGDGPMPASFGYHPAFRWPLPYGARADHVITFDMEEPAPIRRLDSAGLVRAARYPTPIQARRLRPDDALFKDDVVILDAIRSHGVSYGAEPGPRLILNFPDTPYLGLWSKPGAPFICIEPWHGMADPVGYAGDFTAKPGVFLVPSGAQRAFSLQITLAGA
jgi:galactose mutarotase-like enzyme